MSEVDTKGDDGTMSKPVYEVSATEEGTEWLLSCDAPGGTINHAVRSMEDLDWVTREMRTVVASHLGIADDDFDLRFSTTAG